MKLYCDVINQRFVKGYRIPSIADIIVTQNNDIEGKFYLLQPNQNSSRFPFMFDPASVASGMSATAALCNPGGLPLTLTSPVALTLIANGFAGTIHTNTDEIVTFLAGYSERKCALAIEVTDADGNHVTSFQSEVILRAASTEAGTVSIPGVLRLHGITGYVGGGITNLDGVVTVGRTVGIQFQVTIDGSESHWEYTGPGVTPSDIDVGVILTTDGGQLRRTIGF